MHVRLPVLVAATLPHVPAARHVRVAQAVRRHPHSGVLAVAIGGRGPRGRAGGREHGDGAQAVLLAVHCVDACVVRAHRHLPLRVRVRVRVKVRLNPT